MPLTLPTEPNNYSRTEDVNIIKLDLITQGGTFNLLKDALVELNIFESIFEFCTTGYILIRDTFNLPEKGPIVGDEKLVVSFQTSAQGGFSVYNKTFDVFKMSERKDVNGKRSQTYVLHFASPQLDANQKVRIQRSFIDMTEDKICQIVAENQLGIADINTEGTKYERKLIVPAWRPFHLINYLCSSAIRPIGDSPTSYLFFEDQEKFNFVSTDSLMEAGPVFTLHNQLARISAASSHIKHNVSSFEVIKSFDTLADSARGMYGVKMTLLDFEKKKYEFNEKTYDGHFGGTVHLEENKVRVNPPSDSERFFQVASNYNQQEHIDEWGQFRSMDIQQMEHFIFECEMKGDTGLLVGSVVEYDFPKMDYTAEEGGLDEKFSGKYLVTSIRHTLNYRQHTMKVEIRKPNLKS